MKSPLIFLMAFLCASTPALAVVAEAEGSAAASQEDKDSSLVGAPLIVSNPAFGDGVGVVGMYLYGPDEGDEVSPKSIVGVVGLYSNTDSFTVGLFNNAFFKEDTWRLSAGGGAGKVNNRFDVPEFGDVNFATEFRGVGARLEYRLFGDMFIGAQAGFKDIQYQEGNEASERYFDTFEVEDNSSWVLGFLVSFDTRDDPRYPHSGVITTANLSLVPEFMGAKDGYVALELSANGYHQWREDHVVALRGYGRFTPDDTPYVGLSSLGRRSDLRGYVAGEKVAENLLSTQLEYRWLFSSRVGVVGFTGVAALYDDGISQINRDVIYTSSGVGLRVVMQKEARINFRVDYAWGEDDESGLYVSVGEAF